MAASGVSGETFETLNGLKHLLLQRGSRMSRKVLERLTSCLTVNYRGAGFQYAELHTVTGTSGIFKKACSSTAESFWFEAFWVLFCVWFFYIK